MITRLRLKSSGRDELFQGLSRAKQEATFSVSVNADARFQTLLSEFKTINKSETKHEVALGHAFRIKIRIFNGLEKGTSASNSHEQTLVQRGGTED